MTGWTESKAKDYLTTAYLDVMGPRVDNSALLEEDVIGRINDPQGAASIVVFLLGAIWAKKALGVDGGSTGTTAKIKSAADFLGIDHGQGNFPEI